MSRRLAVMQPYVFPYLGYFQLIRAVDRFVIFDDVHFIKRGWIHRNAILSNGQALRFTIPLNRASQHKLINETELHPVEYAAWQQKFLKTLRQNYKSAPHFASVFSIVEKVLNEPGPTIATLATASLRAVADYLQLSTTFVVSSSLTYDRNTKGQEKILTIVQEQEASVYINPPGGAELYEPKAFAEKEVWLQFIQPHEVSYPQFKEPFVPNLSILDVMMFNDSSQIQQLLQQYDLISPETMNHDRT